MDEREVLTADQAAFYEENGYLLLENRVPMDIIEAIRAEVARFHEEARGMTESNDRNFSIVFFATVGATTESEFSSS